MKERPPLKIYKCVHFHFYKAAINLPLLTNNPSISFASSYFINVPIEIN